MPEDTGRWDGCGATPEADIRRMVAHLKKVAERPVPEMDLECDADQQAAYISGVLSRAIVTAAQASFDSKRQIVNIDAECRCAVADVIRPIVRLAILQRRAEYAGRSTRLPPGEKGAYWVWNPYAKRWNIEQIHVEREFSSLRISRMSPGDPEEEWTASEDWNHWTVGPIATPPDPKEE